MWKLNGFFVAFHYQLSVCVLELCHNFKIKEAGFHFLLLLLNACYQNLIEIVIIYSLSNMEKKTKSKYTYCEQNIISNIQNNERISIYSMKWKNKKEIHVVATNLKWCCKINTRIHTATITMTFFSLNLNQFFFHSNNFYTHVVLLPLKRAKKRKYCNIFHQCWCWTCKLLEWTLINSSFKALW